MAFIQRDFTQEGREEAHNVHHVHIEGIITNDNKWLSPVNIDVRVV
jgi:hypothetical protein